MLPHLPGPASAQVAITEHAAEVRFGKQAHNPYLLVTGFPETNVLVSWWKGRKLRLVFD